MKREILFRGKRINNVTNKYEWIYGYLFIGNEHVYILSEKSSFEKDNAIIKKMRVDPETVGQYTGLKDKNGNRVFEGDCMQNGIYVAWNPMECRWGWFDKNGGYVAPLIANPYNPDGRLAKEWSIQDHVLFNIHDNPELLT